MAQEAVFRLHWGDYLTPTSASATYNKTMVLPNATQYSTELLVPAN